MAKVYFTLDILFDAPAKAVWDALVDWKGHEKWIPSTFVELHGAGDPTAVGSEFTAWTGLALGTKVGRKLALEDHMRVDALEFDESRQTGECLVTKLGSPLTGTAAFTVAPAAGRRQATQMNWVEDVKVAYAPQFLAPLFAMIGKAGFQFGMRRLARQLESPRS